MFDFDTFLSVVNHTPLVAVDRVLYSVATAVRNPFRDAPKH